MSNQNDSRWWEFYGIRYAQGTVVGAMFVYFLFSQNEKLKNILFIPSDPKDFGMPHLILLAIYGLAYCYIASAPILVMHAGRGFLFASATNPDPHKGKMARRFFAGGLPLVVSTIYYFTGSHPITGALALFVYTFVLAMQITIIASIFHFRWNQTIDYYKKIVTVQRE